VVSGTPGQTEVGLCPAYLSISVNIPKLHSDALASLLPVDIIHETCRIENIYARLG